MRVKISAEKKRILAGGHRIPPHEVPDLMQLSTLASFCMSAAVALG
jgi:hypothetical protein